MGFQYEIFVFQWGNEGDPFKSWAEAKATLNALGADGWAVVASFIETDNYLRCLLLSRPTP